MLTTNSRLFKVGYTSFKSSFLQVTLVRKPCFSQSEIFLNFVWPGIHSIDERHLVFWYFSKLAQLQKQKSIRSPFVKNKSLPITIHCLYLYPQNYHHSHSCPPLYFNNFISTFITHLNIHISHPLSKTFIQFLLELLLFIKEKRTHTQSIQFYISSIPFMHFYTPTLQTHTILLDMRGTP